MVNFKDLLSKPLDNVERPKALPAGTFYGMVKSYELKESNEKKTPFVEFTLAVQSAGEDVDQADMEGVDLSKKSLRARFFITPDSEYRLKEFIGSLGIPTTGRSFGETLPETVSQPVMIDVTQRQSTDGQDIFNDVQRVRGQTNE
jgi:hypothetical protein